MAVTRETYLATVSTNDDPDKRGRIKVLCTQLMGSEEEECPVWVDPIYDWGWFVVPDPGEIVEIEVATGSTEDEQMGQFSIDNLDIRWRQTREYGNTEAEDEQLKRPIPEDFTANNYGKRRGFATPLGHFIMFDDTPNDPKVSISWISGDGDDATYAFLTFDKQGVKLASKPHGDDEVQHCLFFNHETSEISIIDSTGNSISTMPNGIKIVAAKDGSSDTNIEIKNSGVIQILGGKQVTVSAPAVQLDSGGVVLGSGLAPAIIEPAVLGNILVSLLGTHTHPTGMGPSGPPIGGEAFFAAAKALEVKVK